MKIKHFEGLRLILFQHFEAFSTAVAFKKVIANGFISKALTYQQGFLLEKGSFW